MSDDEVINEQEIHTKENRDSSFLISNLDLEESNLELPMDNESGKYNE